MRTWMLKIAAAALLVLVSVIGAFALPHAGSAPGAESAITSTLAMSTPSFSADTADAASGSTKMIVGQAFEGSATVIASPALITAGVCAALIGCCILGLILLRRYLQGGQRSSWVATLRRMSPVASAPMPLAWPIRPSLVFLSISRT